MLYHMPCHAMPYGRLPLAGGEQFCYFCAGLTPAVRATHAMSACPKRRKACQREYSEDAKTLLCAELWTRRQQCTATLSALQQIEEPCRQRPKAKRELLALTAATKLLGKHDDEATCPAEPSAAPPVSERRRAWEAYARRRQGEAMQLVGHRHVRIHRCTCACAQGGGQGEAMQLVGHRG